ncbi:MAG: N-acetylmuramoyl-L-alanine amidase [Lachnospiraceae bacterium]|nr:N-acetylmuramoyl-L-alanine amidase [Lachnospiraceae bacterium]MCI9388087.1 N-acetylmuramoyl-L-alanine amidase [Lachnospiraceae bacterium]MCI9470421.1 N-acetylmuramoyl-L-alanine amidase [Lachnospiraceae bacterium]
MPEYKIMLDAGHGGEDPGAVSGGRQEKDDTLRLTLAVGDLLKNRGVDVEYTRTTDVYQTPFQKATIANQSGADYFISFHRNSSPTPNQYTGVETLIYNKSGIKYDMAKNIVGALGEVGFQDLGVKERPGLVVLRRTTMPAVLIEAGFLNTDQDNRMFDEKFDEIAQAIASAILGTLGEEDVEGPTYYRVQAGAFTKRQNADQLLYELLDQGYPAFLLNEDGYYKVQVGAYLQLGNAIAMEQKLRDAGYSTMITTR